MNIKYAIVKNEMPASATEAKYLGRIIPNGVRNRKQLTALALKSEHFAEATFDAVIDAAVDITQELCAEGRDVDWGTVKFLSKMHGSLPYEDSAFADGTASLTLDADATNVTRTTLDTLTPVKVSAAEIDTLIKVSNVMDVATELFGTVIGTTQFVVLGNSLTLDGEDEYAKALDKKTGEVKGTATVQSVSKGQRAYCKFDPQLAAGEYTLEVATKGLLGETTPRILRKPFTAVYVAPPAPTITKVATVGKEGVARNMPYEMEGTNFSSACAVKAKWTSGSTPQEQALTPTSVTPTKMSFAWTLPYIATGTVVTFEVTAGGVTVSKTATVLDGPEVVTFGDVFGYLDDTTLHLTCDHLDALTGAVIEGGEAVSAPVTVKRPGKADETVNVQGASGEYSGNVGTAFAEGETFTIEATVDPAKTQYVQGQVTATGSVIEG